jgi:16S rRNA (guanine527-N7)-methyltransferase
MGALERLLEALAREPDPHTTVSSPAEAMDVHVADSLVALELEFVPGARTIADIGAGAGFPGLPLALALPEARVDLIEASSRKVAVIERLAAAAGVANARAVRARAEEWGGPGAEGASAYDLVVARAVGPLAVLAEYAAPLLRLGGHLVAWKGEVGAEEQRGGEAAAAQLGLEPGEVRFVKPFEVAERRHLHVFTKSAETPERFPRRPGMAAKRPLG